MKKMTEKQYFEMLEQTCEKCKYYDKQTNFCEVCFCNDELCDLQEEYLRKKGVDNFNFYVL